MVTTGIIVKLNILRGAFADPGAFPQQATNSSSFYTFKQVVVSAFKKNIFDYSQKLRFSLFPLQRLACLEKNAAAKKNDLFGKL